eukprot:216900_1
MRTLLVTLALAVGSMALMPLNPMRMGLNAKPVGIAMRMGNGRLFGRVYGRFGLSLRSSGISRCLCHFNKRGLGGGWSTNGGIIIGRRGRRGCGDDPPNKPPPCGPLSQSFDPEDEGSNGNPIWAAYNRQLESNPILIKASTSFIGFALGDLLAQKFINKDDELDLKRLLRLAMFGFLIHGPTGHLFYGMLDAKIPGTDALTVAKKVFIDQAIWNPIFGVMFFTYNGITHGVRGREIIENVQKNLLSAVRGSWTVWPVAHAINFRFIPTSQRLLYINAVQVGYNVFLSVLAKNANTSSPQKERSQ